MTACGSDCSLKLCLIRVPRWGARIFLPGCSVFTGQARPALPGLAAYWCRVMYERPSPVRQKGMFHGLKGRVLRCKRLPFATLFMSSSYACGVACCCGAAFLLAFSGVISYLCHGISRVVRTGRAFASPAGSAIFPV